MKLLLLQGFNNYFNRKIIKYESKSDYITNADDYLLLKNINFVEGDGVNTTQIIGVGTTTEYLKDKTDYVVCLSDSDDPEVINSRWFVMKSIKLRGQQYELTLRRDVIADNLTQLLSCPMFVQKGMLQNTDPFIFNDEGMSFNQIKTSETLLKDKTNSAWIIGYIAKNAAPSDVSIDVPDDSFIATTLSDISADTGISEAILSSLLNFGGNNNPAYFTKEIEFRFGYNALLPNYGWNPIQRARVFMNPDLTSGTTSTNDVLSWAKPLWTEVVSGNPTSALKDALIYYKNNILGQLSTVFNHPYLTEAQYNKLTAYQNNNAIIFYNGNYYKMSFNVAGDETEVFGPAVYSSFSTYITSAVVRANTNITCSSAGGFKNDGELSIRPTSTKVFIQMELVSNISEEIPAVSTKISSSRKVLVNQPFDMFAIPYGEVLFTGDLGDQKTNATYARSVASAIATKLSSACYDIQLLPYCPFLEYFNNAQHKIDLTDLNEDVDFNYIDKTSSTARVSQTKIVECDQDPLSQTGYSGKAWIDVPLASADITNRGFTFNFGEEYTSYPTIQKIVIDATHTRIEFSCDIQDGTITTGMVSINIWYEYSGTTHDSFIFWCNNNSFSTRITKSLTAQSNIKVDVLCDKYRLVSPNYQGSFEFNVAKNGGKVDYFLAEATYRPYNPYIKVAPNFNYLYGTNFGDCRGLICGGDFSLGIMTSAWEAYQLNNKNYQNIFNREIQTLDIAQDIQRRQQIFGSVAGIFNDAAKGATTGDMSGGGWGALAGGVIGAGISSIGAGLDYDILMRQQREQKGLTIDKYNYQLGNIKALPYTLTKVGAFDINSKIFPFLEYYTATEEEIEALENKIKYESMTVMRIDYLANYFNGNENQHYFKAELIRSDNNAINGSEQLYSAIYSELLKGVFI